ncbi:aliphatic sulfonate ABC transporter substrate-binding protein [Rhizobium ruizarguesonis]|uniref:aliphatic sulfonate ABC transporter substrate-binding protein n=2 Tax=Rhizobium ruizarguesonis TaxID=2081791 RepID=UPI000A30F3A1|nr:aliphatic sulfonate ABC transporter substrate-binding protein [Rhizobium ruizarguesonis]TAZ70202.1 aliphatic sulfonate ABC transporter substrate-binding protein [Rhizobium ruizarguesonis]TAZ92734.1 aliphatic sulfonate ABC transporter substrate-binding protein [Rhizobium ruizarguesonis]TBA11362.1 aliphatic sulfonate ABC transporter substrate-binding protein [Rhizobium ruizarguesonis]TBA33889.1 aliphatic sulfonate ABC transporter substrate-binding protein [Rhizobium ruizarguesonis]
MLTRRNLMKTTAAVAAAGTFAIGGRASAQPADMTIGYIADFPNASVLAIAQDQKYWEAEGITPNVKVFTNGPIQIQAMGAGSLNFGTIGPGALWLPASGKAKVVGVNDIGFSDRVITQAGIASIKDLKGKKVGVPQGTSGDMILRMALTKNGMTINDIQVVPMDPSTVVAAFSSKQIDAAGIWYPLIDTIKLRVPDMKELVSNQDFFPQTSFINTFVARNEIVQQNPDLVKKFLRVMKKAMDYRVANLDRSIQITTVFLNAPADATEKVARSRKILTSKELDALTKDGTVNKWLTDFNKMFQEFGTVKDPLPAEQYYTADLFTGA